MRPADSFLTELAKAAKRGGSSIDANTVMQVAQQLGAAVPQGANVGPGAGFFNRLKDAGRYLVTGVGPSTWFGPWQPIQPMADRPEQGAIGRQFDYPVGHNTKILPRQGEGITFDTLRAFGDNYDLLRLAIETCKDQLETFEWEIVPEDEKADHAQYADEIRRVSDFLEYPDREHNWSQWFRMCMEDMLVIDAIALFPTKTRGGGTYSLDLVDGATITRVINEYGRTPMPEEGPAYRQILKGVPAVNYTRDDLIYMVRNPRTNRLYGMSPVEQVLMTVNIAMRRQVHQLQEYTEGNIPSMIVSLPDTWTSSQIKDFQDWFDTLLAGQTGERRKIRFIPETKGITPIVPQSLKDDYDEWLARIICWALSIAPNALIKQMNRAASEQIAESAKEEGQLPRLRWFAVQMNYILKKTLGMQGVKFKWKIARPVDPEAQARIDGIYLAQGVRTNEMQQRLGIEEAPEPVAQPAALAGAVQPTEEELKPGESVVAEKLTKATPRVTRVAKYVAANQQRVAKKIAAVLAKQRQAVAAKIVARFKALSKGDKDIIDQILNDVDEDGISTLIVEAVTADMKKAFKQAGIVGVNQTSIDVTPDIVRHLDKAALDYAETHGAELVTQISKTTEAALRSVVTNAVEQGSSAEGLAKAIDEMGAFGEARALTIARTELAFAHVQGNIAGWKESGEVIGKRWVLGDTHPGEDICDECANIGVVGLDEEFVDGITEPPAHPNCICDVLPVLAGED